MKKFLIAVAIFFAVILLAVILVPIIFKDDIRAAVDKALAESVNADIVWDTNDFSVSLIRNFPNATAELDNFGVINRAPFQGEILFAVQEFHVEVNILSLFKDQVKIEGVELVHPEINIKVLEDGTANYDIAITAPEDTIANVEGEEPVAYNIGVDHWSIVDGVISYHDATIPLALEITNFNHSGSGDFTQDVIDVTTDTHADSLTVIFDGIEYVSEKTLNANVGLTISDNYTKYTFSENNVGLNDFALGLNGWLKLNDDGSMDMDLLYGAKETSFKSLLSLVPGVYTEGFNDIETSGSLAFDGMAKGHYDSLQLPAFMFALKVNDGRFKYPDLPSAVSNINLDLKVNNDGGALENTKIDLSKLHIEFGDNPFDASLQIENLKDYRMKANLSGDINLGNINAMFPVEGLAMQGNLTMNVKADGVYDSVANKTPAIDAAISLRNGYVKSNELPYALEALKFDATVNNPTGEMEDFSASLQDFSMLMDNEPFNASAKFKNLNDYNWDVNVSGGVDLQKITALFPMEGMTLAGIIKADITTAGTMSALEAERYEQLPTSGTMSIASFRYEDAALPYDVTISKAKAVFNPRQISLTDYQGTIGTSDIALSGSVSNYIGYLFGENETLKGAFTMNSNSLDLNQFMTEEEDTSEPATDEPGGVVTVPADIDFVLNSTIAKVTLMDMTMNNASGVIIVREGVVDLNSLKFGLLDGQFAVSGKYDPRDTTKPKYDFTLDIDNLSAQQAFKTFSVVQGYFPIANKLSGNLSTDLAINGLLDQEMMPDLKTIAGRGLINIAQAQVQNSKTLQKIASAASLNTLSSKDAVDIKDILMNVTIEDGKVNIKPFDLEVAGYKANLSGASYLDGTLDLKMKMNIPAGALGSAANSLISKYTGGGSAAASDIIPIGIGIKGTHDDPRITLDASEQKQQIKEAAVNVVKDKVADQLGLDEADKEKQRQKVMEEAQAQADKIKAEGKRAADRVRSEGYAQADKLVKEAGSNILKKKIAEEAAKKIKQETDEKAGKIETEAQQKADNIMAEAKKKADSV